MNVWKYDDDYETTSEPKRSDICVARPFVFLVSFVFI